MGMGMLVSFCWWGFFYNGKCNVDIIEFGFWIASVYSFPGLAGFVNLLYLGIHVRRFLNADWICWNYFLKGHLEIFGRSQGIRKSLLEGSGDVPEAPKMLQKWLREGKKRPRASKSHLEAILELSFGVLGRPVGRLLGSWGGLWGGFETSRWRFGTSRWRFLGWSCCASLFYRFFIDFQTFLGRFLVSKINEKTVKKTKLFFKCFLNVFCDVSVSSPSQRVLRKSGFRVVFYDVSWTFDFF